MAETEKMLEEVLCPKCAGTGRCRICGGTGKILPLTHPCTCVSGQCRNCQGTGKTEYSVLIVSADEPQK